MKLRFKVGDLIIHDPPFNTPQYTWEVTLIEKTLNVHLKNIVTGEVAISNYHRIAKVYSVHKASIFDDQLKEIL